MVHGSFNRFVYTTWFSTINKIYHKVLLVSILVAMVCLFRASHRLSFYGFKGSRGLPFGQIWVPVPMVHWSGTGEVGSFHLVMDLIPWKWLAIPFPGSIYFRGIHMDQHHGLQ